MRLNIDMTRERFDLAAHDVHTDAAPRNIGDLLRRGKAGQEDETNGIRIVETIRFVLRDHALFHRLAADDVGVDARTVVRDHDNDVIALMTRNKPHLTDARLPFCLALVGTLDTVVE